MINLVINTGSATTKYSFFLKNEKLLKVVYQKKGRGGYEIIISKDELSQSVDVSKAIFTRSLNDLFKRSVVKSLLAEGALEVIGFRIVHGGNLFDEPTEVSKKILNQLKKLDHLAPLHNPFARKLIEETEKKFPKLKKILVFDTTFHNSLPKINSTYALPKKISEQFGLKKYGFHGIAYQSIVRQLKKQRKLSKNIIACHLGGGCSVTALRNGKSIDTSMGFTPLEGLVMGTRAGDIDPGLLLYLQKVLKKSPDQLLEILNSESGLIGLTGTSDMRMIIGMKLLKHPAATLAFEIFCQKIAQKIATYIVTLKGVDRIVFSGGIGENSHEVRQAVIDHLKCFKISINKGRNKVSKPGQELSRIFSKAKVCYLHIDEALEINQRL
ncbi:MAG: acetate/propionate family kinase [Candidatus Gracilibacteria bacterium]|nr:acetate/propionate family kinase [Candidatus Gracilibacteria bacterium]